MNGFQRPIGAWGFFAINFAIAAWLSCALVAEFVASDSPIAYAGIIFAVCPFAYGSAELLAFIRADYAAERWLGILNMWSAAFATFALITNVGEGLRYGPAWSVQSWCEFVAVFGVIIAYLTACGLYRLRRTHRLAVSS
jgi:hypothetical protein